MPPIRKKLPSLIFALIAISFTLFLQLIEPSVHADNIDVVYQIPISGETHISVCESKTDPAGKHLLECAGIATYIDTIYKWAIAFAAVLAVLAFTYAGVLWLIAGGDAGKITESKKVMGNAVIGLLFALCSYALLFAINPDLVQFNPLRLTPIQQIDVDFKSIEVIGEETGDTPKAGEEEVEFVVEEGTFDHRRLRTKTIGFFLPAQTAYAAVKKRIVISRGTTLANLDTYITSGQQFGLDPNRCLGWTRLSLESIFGTKKIKETAIYPRLEYPAATAHQFNTRGMYVRTRSLAGVNNGDVVFMKIANSFLVARGVDKGPGGDSISHIGVYYNGHIYHQFGSKLSKDTIENGVLKNRRARDGTTVDITGYGRMGL